MLEWDEPATEEEITEPMDEERWCDDNIDTSRRQCADIKPSSVAGRLNFLTRYASVARDTAYDPTDEAEKVSAEVREQRRKKGQHYFCGNSTHQARYCPLAKTKKDFGPGQRQFHWDNSDESAFIVTLMEQVGMYECPKWLASEVWAADDGVTNRNMGTVSHFDQAWDKFTKYGTLNAFGAWVPRRWEDHWIHHLGRNLRIVVIASFPNAFDRGQYEK